MEKLIEYTTKCHPEANGRTAASGDVEYAPQFPLDNGDILRIRMGKEGFERFSQFILDMMADTPSYGDDSVDFDRPPDIKN